MNDYRELHELYHHGIKGQQWGVRRYQNPDGTLTELGKKRYHVEYDGWTGQTKVVDQQGKKMSGGEKAFFENEMKQRARTDAEFNKKYIQYRQNKDQVLSNNLITYGNAAAGTGYNNLSYASLVRQGTARQGKREVDDLLSEFANSYLDDVAKQSKKG